MFSNKMNNSGWILCPSKRFPGKFYYYNVLNGESAWSFNETEKKFLRIDDKTKLITQKWHCYPEPVSPPGKGLNCFTRSNSLFSQKFGQATFQKYFNSCAIKQPKPNILKTPIFDIPIKKKTEIPKKNIDIQTDLPETGIMVQTCKEPLSKRFWKYQNYDNDNKASSTKINWLPEIIESDEHYLDSANKNYLESNKKFTNTTNELKMKQSTEHNSENLFFMNQNSVQTKTNSPNTCSNTVQLADNDLRYILQAKRSENKTDEPQNNTIKKVRFDLTPDVTIIDDESDLKNETAIRDTSNTMTAKIIKHIQNTEKSFNVMKNRHIEDDLKNIKFVVKNSNPENFFLQSDREINPFQFKYEKITNLGKMLRDQSVDLLNLSNQNQYSTSVPDNNNYEILNQDILNVTKSIKEKLHVWVPNEKQFGSNSKIRFLKSSPQENPFKKYKTKINPYLKYKSSAKINVGSPYLLAPNKFIRNNFKVPNIKSLEHKEVTSSRDVNYFGSKLHHYNSTPTNYDSNFMSASDHTDDQTNFRYSNINSKVTEECMTFSETNKIGNRNSWLDEKLKKFYSRNSYIEKMVIIRMDEIICCFTQIMEDLIYNILETSTCPPPCSLYDAILCLQRRFSDHTHILQVADKITDLDIFCSKTGYLKDNVHPYELIKAVGCGLVFIEALNELQEFDVKDAENALLHLIRDIEDPQYAELPQLTTTVNREDSPDQPDRVNFIKGRADILTYLQNHFPEWKNYHDEQDQVHITNTGHNVVVTTGKDLHLFKINNKNQMYCQPEEGQKETNDSRGDNNKCDGNKVIRKFHVIDKFENRISELNNEDSNSFQGSKQVSESNHSNNEEKIDKEICEEKYNNGVTEMNNFCEENKYSDESLVLIETEKIGTEEIIETKPVCSPHMDNSTRINESSTITDDFPVLNNDPITHYYADDANQYYSFVKIFLTELSNTLLLIHAFIKDSVDRFHDTEMTDDDRKELHEEATQTYDNLRNIILELKSIVDRETRDENALRILLIGADGALQDKRITNYRQVVSKCLEQARQLAGCLRLLLRATGRDCTLSGSSDAGDTTCINIFE